MINIKKVYHCTINKKRVKLILELGNSGFTLWVDDNDEGRHWVVDASIITKDNKITVATSRYHWNVHLVKDKKFNWEDHQVYELQSNKTKKTKKKVKKK